MQLETVILKETITPYLLETENPAVGKVIRSIIMDKRRQIGSLAEITLEPVTVRPNIKLIGAWQNTVFT